MQQNPNLRFQVVQVNELLKDIYRCCRRISDILRDGGVDNESLGKLKQEHLEPFYSRLLYHWYEWIVFETNSRGAYVLFRRYGLNGQPRLVLADIGEQLGVSRERIRQIEKKTFQRLRSPRCRRILEKLAVMAAQEVLGNDQLQVNKPADLAPVEEEIPSIEATVPGNAIENLEAAILAVVHQMPAKLPRSGVAKLLVGSPSVGLEALRTHPLYGTFRTYCRSAIVRIVDRLIESGKLDLRGKRLIPSVPRTQQGVSELQ